MSARLARCPSKDQEERFWYWVDEMPSGCWEWQGARDWAGYGQAAWNRRRVRAARLAYTLVVGVIPEGLTIDHLCRNKACVNPAHLEAVTMRENYRRRERDSATRCRRGHPYDDANTLWIRPKGENPYRTCRACTRERARRRREENPEPGRAACRKWRANQRA